MFNNYAIVQGVDHIVPVDVYLPGCPPRPEMLLHAIITLHEQIQSMPLGVNRERQVTELEEARLRRLPLAVSAVQPVRAVAARQLSRPGRARTRGLADSGHDQATGCPATSRTARRGRRWQSSTAVPDPAAAGRPGAAGRAGRAGPACSAPRRTGDTSGYGGLQVRRAPRLASPRPYGSYFDEIADNLEAGLAAGRRLQLR